MLLEVIFQLCNYKTQEGIQQNNNILSTKYKAFNHLSMHFYLLFEISYKNVKKTRCSATDEWLRVFRIKMAKEMATFVAELGYWKAQYRSKVKEYLYYYILLYPTCQWSIGLCSIPGDRNETFEGKNQHNHWQWSIIKAQIWSGAGWPFSVPVYQLCVKGVHAEKGSWKETTRTSWWLVPILMLHPPHILS